MAVINKWVTGVIALLIGVINPILWLVGAHRLHVSYPVFFGCSQDPGRPKKKGFSFSWKTAMSLPFTTSAASGPTEWLRLFKRELRVEDPKTKEQHPFSRPLFCYGRSASFFLTKKELKSIIVQWIFDGLKRSPLQNIEPNLGDVPGLCPDQSNSHWVPNPQKTRLFLMNFFRGYSFSKQKNHHYKINSKGETKNPIRSEFRMTK